MTSVATEEHSILISTGCLLSSQCLGSRSLRSNGRHLIRMPLRRSQTSNTSLHLTPSTTQIRSPKEIVLPYRHISRWPLQECDTTGFDLLTASETPRSESELSALSLHVLSIACLSSYLLPLLLNYP